MGPRCRQFLAFGSLCSAYSVRDFHSLEIFKMSLIPLSMLGAHNAYKSCRQNLATTTGYEMMGVYFKI
jgi:hypothetical protein